MLSIIQAAGWPIWPLIACSVVALALIAERLVSLKTTRVAPPNLLDEAIAVAESAAFINGNDEIIIMGGGQIYADRKSVV